MASESNYILSELKTQLDENRAAFSNSNMVRMREAIRYLTKKKLQIFIKIPFLLHINSPQYPGFIDSDVPCHGICNFANSGFFKEALKTKIFPKSIIDHKKVEDPAIVGFYHIGSLGTFTQSQGSDFDFWVIIDKKTFSKERYACLEKKLDALLKYSREEYDQEVSFFIMDQEDIKNDRYAPFKGEETMTVPKIFLKEEFYRTFLMIAGKIPVWAVLPDLNDPVMDTVEKREGVTNQILSMDADLINLGQVSKIPVRDILKGLLWHICKSTEDPVKAVIKATMVFTYGYDAEQTTGLLCEKIKSGYEKAGIDDYGVDPYKALFDRILEFHEAEDPKGINLIKNAIFFRLCHYPDVKIPDQKTPKRQLLDKYIREWKLNKTQVLKLLSYATWSEAEKLLLEKALIHRLAQMYNHVLKANLAENAALEKGEERKTWLILKNKIRLKLKQNPDKIKECSTYLKRRHISTLNILKGSKFWVLNIVVDGEQKIDRAYYHKNFLCVIGWIMENGLYQRQRAFININAACFLYESIEKPVDADKLYMIFQPLKALSDSYFEKNPVWVKMVVLMHHENANISRAEFLVSNSWGELFFDSIEFEKGATGEVKYNLVAKMIQKYSSERLRFNIFQFCDNYDSTIVYEVKKAYDILAYPNGRIMQRKKKPYLDIL
jgi:adenylate cyclase class 1